jgi:hypothetical protein
MAMVKDANTAAAATRFILLPFEFAALQKNGVGTGPGQGWTCASHKIFAFSWIGRAFSDLSSLSAPGATVCGTRKIRQTGRRRSPIRACTPIYVTRGLTGAQGGAIS